MQILVFLHLLNLEREIFESDLPGLSLDFNNMETTKCPKISFIHLEIEGEPKTYKPYLNNYFRDSLVLELYWENTIEFKFNESIKQLEKLSVLSLFKKYFSKKLRMLLKK